jgi:hypothetical protein
MHWDFPRYIGGFRGVKNSTCFVAIMNRKKLRDIVFYLHQYIGFFVGLLLILIGLTGSLLVFEQDY